MASLKQYRGRFKRRHFDRQIIILRIRLSVSNTPSYRNLAEMTPEHGRYHGKLVTR